MRISPVVNAMRTRAVLVAALLASACGGGEQPSEDETTTTTAEVDTAGAEQTEAPEEEAEGTPYPANPVLNMYVQGPNPSPGEYLDGTPDDYRASIIVTNTGDAPAQVGFARIRLEAWRDGEPIDCATGSETESIEGPEVLEPGTAHTYEAELHCEQPGTSDLEIRAYMAFGADGPELHRERHYAGSFVLSASP